MGCVLEVEGDAVRVSLNPALVEGSDSRREEEGEEGEEGEEEEEGEEGRRKRRKSAVNRQAMVSVGWEDMEVLTLSCPPQLQGGVSVVGTVELATPHYLLVTLRTLSGSLLAYAATDSVSCPSSHPQLSSCLSLSPVVPRASWKSSLPPTPTSRLGRRSLLWCTGVGERWSVRCIMS